MAQGPELKSLKSFIKLSGALQTKVGLHTPPHVQTVHTCSWGNQLLLTAHYSCYTMLLSQPCCQLFTTCYPRGLECAHLRSTGAAPPIATRGPASEVQGSGGMREKDGGSIRGIWRWKMYCGSTPLDWGISWASHTYSWYSKWPMQPIYTYTLAHTTPS